MKLNKKAIKKLNKQRKQAVKNGEKTFVFMGELVTTKFAKHLVKMLKELVGDPTMIKSVNTLSEKNDKQATRSLIDFLNDSEISMKEFDLVLDGIGKKLRETFSDRGKTHFDEASEDTQRGIALSALLDGAVGLAVVEKSDGEAETATKH